MLDVINMMIIDMGILKFSCMVIFFVSFWVLVLSVITKLHQIEVAKQKTDKIADFKLPFGDNYIYSVITKGDIEWINTYGGHEYFKVNGKGNITIEFNKKEIKCLK